MGMLVSGIKVCYIRLHIYIYGVVSQNRGTPIQNTIVLIMGTPKMVPLVLGNPHIETYGIQYKS